MAILVNDKLKVQNGDQGSPRSSAMEKRRRAPKSSPTGILTVDSLSAHEISGILGLGDVVGRQPILV